MEHIDPALHVLNKITLPGILFNPNCSSERGAMIISILYMRALSLTEVLRDVPGCSISKQGF